LFYVSDVTRILSQIESGDPAAAEQLLPLVYDELRKLAVAKLAHEKPGQTLQATALVHEAYLRLVGGGNRELEVGSRGQAEEARGQDSESGHPHPGPLPEGEGARQQWDGRGHFFGAAAEAMRRILVEQARRKGRLKRGGDIERVELDEVEISVDAPGLDMLALDDALKRLAAKHPEKAELVKLRYFAGLTGDEAAAALGISPATADRNWTYARAWLVRELSPDGAK
jgi:RNA polymerase sigma factor (sigma-70 family)